MTEIAQFAARFPITKRCQEKLDNIRSGRLRDAWRSWDDGEQLAWALDQLGFRGYESIRLCACACARQPELWALLHDKRCHRAIEEASRFAEGKATEQQLATANGLAHEAEHSAQAAYDALDVQLDRSEAWTQCDGATAALVADKEARLAAARLVVRLTAEPTVLVTYASQNSWASWFTDVVAESFWNVADDPQQDRNRRDLLAKTRRYQAERIRKIIPWPQWQPLIEEHLAQPLDLDRIQSGLRECCDRAVSETLVADYPFAPHTETALTACFREIARFLPLTFLRFYEFHPQDATVCELGGASATGTYLKYYGGPIIAVPESELSAIVHAPTGVTQLFNRAQDSPLLKTLAWTQQSRPERAFSALLSTVNVAGDPGALMIYDYGEEVYVEHKARLLKKLHSSFTTMFRALRRAAGSQGSD